MAGGTADDEKDGRPSSSGSAEALPGDHAADTARPPASPQTEWTVSDRRGPTNPAVPIEAAAPSHVPPTSPGLSSDVERIVPGSEMDAEGAQDSVTPDGDLPSPSPAEVPASAPLAGEMAATEPAEHGTAAVQPGRGDGDPAPPPGPERSSSAAPRRSWWPVAAGIVVGALIGAGSAAAVYTQAAGPGEKSPAAADSGKLADLSARVDALDKRPDPQQAVAGAKSQIAELSGKVAALEKTGQRAPASGASTAPAATPSAPNAQPSPDVATLGAKIAALQTDMDSLKKQNGAQSFAGKLEALQAAMAGVQATARSNADAVKTQQQDLDAKLGALQTTVGGAQKQATTAQAGVDAVRTEQKTLAGKLGAPALAVVADSLVGQIESGKPFTTQVDALASLGADPAKVAVLRQNAANGVPSAQALLASFQPLADPVVATGSKAPANAGFGERLKHGLFGLVSIRRADETTGSDLPSRVALIQADLAHNDVVGAYRVWTALPNDAKAKSDAWGSLAKTSVEAINAARGLQTDSIGALAAKRS